MLGMNQYSDFWKDREQVFKDNCSKFPELQIVWQTDKEKAINSVIGLS